LDEKHIESQFLNKITIRFPFRYPKLKKGEKV